MDNNFILESEGANRKIEKFPQEGGAPVEGYLLLSLTQFVPMNLAKVK